METTYDRLKSINQAAKELHKARDFVKAQAIRHGLAIKDGARLKVDPAALKRALERQVFTPAKRQARTRRVVHSMRTANPDVTC